MPAEEHTPPANVSSAHVSSQVSKDKSVFPDIEELKQHMKEYVDSKFEYLVNLIKANHIEVMNSKNRDDGQQSKDMGGKSTPNMVEVSDEEGNDGHQATSPIQMELDVDNQTEDTLKNHQVMKDVSELQSPNSDTHHTDQTCEHSKDAPSAQTPHHLFEGTMNEDTSDSTPSGSISPDTREAMNTLIAELGSLPTNANQQEFTENQSLLSDSQLPIDIPITDIVVRSEINTPHARIRMPSRNCKSPYLTSFGSSEKGKAVMTDVMRPNFPFQGCEITNQAPSYLIDEFIEWVTAGLLKAHSKKKPSEDKYKSKASSLGFEMMDYVVAFPTNKNWFYAMSQPKNCWTDQHIDVIFYYLRKKSKLRSMDQYRYTTVNCLFSTHINNTHDRYYNNEADDDISTQEHIDRARAVSVHERSIINVMKGFSIPAGLPWHLVDDVYIPINYDGDFHWVLAVVELNKRVIRVYDSSMGTRKRVYSDEIKKLSRMLPSYLIDSGFFENNERTNWSVLDAYKDKQTGVPLESHIPFNIEYAEGIMQQEDDSLDCGLYVATFAEFLSDQLVIPPDTDGHLANYLRNRYAALLWRYGSDKVNGGYISDNEDPPKPKGQFTTPTEDDIVNID
ncbi:uncharacterized protein LOC107029123 [Solanum pennellii]|uniref:Uncharacterized protein LOC107029123 n=1 Tax=Solanum pennellii TaxID=28526 RepID=A0ABM1V1W2_SOLPN|nr:uncharacterized protein LOC107029123 [Solanum pennellii]